MYMYLKCPSFDTQNALYIHHDQWEQGRVGVGDSSVALYGAVQPAEFKMHGTPPYSTSSAINPCSPILLCFVILEHSFQNLDIERLRAKGNDSNRADTKCSRRLGHGRVVRLLRTTPRNVQFRPAVSQTELAGYASLIARARLQDKDMAPGREQHVEC
jgi:hypothetical protein